MPSPAFVSTVYHDVDFSFPLLDDEGASKS